MITLLDQHSVATFRGNTSYFLLANKLFCCLQLEMKVTPFTGCPNQVTVSFTSFQISLKITGVDVFQCSPVWLALAVSTTWSWNFTLFWALAGKFILIQFVHWSRNLWSLPAIVCAGAAQQHALRCLVLPRWVWFILIYSSIVN